MSEKSYEKNTDNKYSTVLTNSAEYGIVKQRDFFDKDIANSSNISGYYVVRKNYFVYNPRISNQAKFGPINRNKLDESGIMSPLYLVFTVHDIDESFLETLFQTTTWHRFMYQNGDTGARADRFAIKDSTFMSMPIKVPSLEEQHKLALAFQKLDQTITLHEEKKRQLERLKSALLQKMFAYKSGYPAIRFEGFSDEWEERKLSDISDVTKLAGFEFTKYVRYQETGKIIALRGLNVKNGKLVLDDVKYIDDSDFSKLNRSKLYKNDILLTYVGTVGELAIVPEDDKYFLAPNVARIRLQDHVNSIFICQMMNNSIFYNHIILPLIATSSQPALSMENVRKFQLLMPDYQEQQKIGSFFKQIDDTIALHQQKINNINSVKKSLLQKMFI
ncbi:restriction endonuclease subunit S [Lactobacillus delbrueckii subsp. bulgaricus]|uniref:restriction endonuclease subunit S n=1 Tax=Lactobacillus delbrueckii TaxID=1584 RepID=UPI001E547EB8|nr:restriction endonuclease subunit S [Lactobacillus delbrueckii subsp. bulgaricus]